MWVPVTMLWVNKGPMDGYRYCALSFCFKDNVNTYWLEKTH